MFSDSLFTATLRLCCSSLDFKLEVKLENWNGGGAVSVLDWLWSRTQFILLCHVSSTMNSQYMLQDVHNYIDSLNSKDTIKL